MLVGAVPVHAPSLRSSNLCGANVSPHLCTIPPMICTAKHRLAQRVTGPNACRCSSCSCAIFAFFKSLRCKRVTSLVHDSAHDLHRKESEGAEGVRTQCLSVQFLFMRHLCVLQIFAVQTCHLTCARFRP